MLSMPPAERPAADEMLQRVRAMRQRYQKPAAPSPASAAADLRAAAAASIKPARALPSSGQVAGAAPAAAPSSPSIARSGGAACEDVHASADVPVAAPTAAPTAARLSPVRSPQAGARTEAVPHSPAAALGPVDLAQSVSFEASFEGSFEASFEAAPDAAFATSVAAVPSASLPRVCAGFDVASWERSVQQLTREARRLEDAERGFFGPPLRGSSSDI